MTLFIVGIAEDSMIYVAASVITAMAITLFGCLCSRLYDKCKRDEYEYLEKPASNPQKKYSGSKHNFMGV
jgi:hypothetical protein